jgi:hypothetical protein
MKFKTSEQVNPMGLMEITTMKPEACFLEIIKFVKENKNSFEDIEDNVTSSVLSYSKMRNFKGTYTYENVFAIGEGACLHFYFSNKRTYISIDKKDMTDYEVSKFQYYLLLYTEALFQKYNIDLFINELQTFTVQE